MSDHEGRLLKSTSLPSDALDFPQKPRESGQNVIFASPSPQHGKKITGARSRKTFAHGGQMTTKRGLGTLKLEHRSACKPPANPLFGR